MSFAGFSEPSNQGQFQKERAASEAALKLNPIGGYVKGSPARRALEDAFCVRASVFPQLGDHQ
jgi:hypothetical protein